MARDDLGMAALSCHDELGQTGNHHAEPAGLENGREIPSEPGQALRKHLVGTHCIPNRSLDVPTDYSTYPH